MTSRFQKVAAGTLNNAETNFRIQAAKVEDLLVDTKCKPRAPGAAQPVATGGYGLHRPYTGRRAEHKRNVDTLFYPEY